MEFNELTKEEKELFVESLKEDLLRKFFLENQKRIQKKWLSGFRLNKLTKADMLKICNAMIQKDNPELFNYCSNFAISFRNQIQKKAKQTNEEEGTPEDISFQMALENSIKPKYQDLYLKLFDKKRIDRSNYQEEVKRISHIAKAEICNSGIENKLTDLENKSKEDIQKIESEIHALASKTEMQSVKNSQEQNVKGIHELKQKVNSLSTSLSSFQSKKEGQFLESRIEQQKDELQKKLNKLEQEISKLKDENSSLKESRKVMSEKDKADTDVLLNTIYDKKINPLEKNEDSEDDLDLVLDDIVGSRVTSKSLVSFKHFLTNIIYSNQPVLTNQIDGDTLGHILSSLLTDGEFYIFYCDSDTSNNELLKKRKSLNFFDGNSHVVVIHSLFGKLDIQPTLHYLEANPNKIKLIFTIPQYRYLKFLPIDSFNKDFIFFHGYFIKRSTDYTCHILFHEHPEEDSCSLKKTLAPFKIHAVPKIYDSCISSWMYYSYIPLISLYYGYDSNDVMDKLSDPNLKTELGELYYE